LALSALLLAWSVYEATEAEWARALAIAAAAVVCGLTATGRMRMPKLIRDALDDAPVRGSITAGGALTVAPVLLIVLTAPGLVWTILLSVAALGGLWITWVALSWERSHRD
jgi:hypothetical protein